MRALKITPLSAGVAALLFLIGASASFLGLGWLARPADFTKRVAAAEAAQQTIRSRRDSGPRRFPDTAVCNQATVAGSQALQAALTQVAGRHGLTVGQIQVAPSSPDRSLIGLSALDIQLVATGPQADALGFIADLEQASPVVFLDQLELRPKGGAVTVQLEGRAFCAIPAR